MNKLTLEKNSELYLVNHIYKKGNDMAEENFKRSLTLCWDCARACGYCSWSSRLKPVKGWVAEKTSKETHGSISSSYIVYECPDFVRDAVGHGLKRYKEGEISETT